MTEAVLLDTGGHARPAPLRWCLLRLAGRTSSSIASPAPSSRRMKPASGAGEAVRHRPPALSVVLPGGRRRQRHQVPALATRAMTHTGIAVIALRNSCTKQYAPVNKFET